MENWKDNKAVHEGVWGKIYDHATFNNKSYNDIKFEWLSLFSFEVGNKTTFNYILDGNVTSGDLDQYVTDKNKYIQNRLDEHVTPTTDLILDLGSGWGRQSIQLAFNNPSYKILAGELSDSGRKVTDYFKNKYDLPIETFSFNWHEYQSLIDLLSSRNYKEIVILTSNTIEQIPYIKEELFTDLLTLPIDKISTIHIEPVKFQYDGIEFPLANHYNRNLKEVLDSLESKKLIEITKVVPKYWGHNLNKTAQNNILIEWKKLS